MESGINRHQVCPPSLPISQTPPELNAIQSCTSARRAFFMDNISTIKMSQHESKTHLRKHIDIRHHYPVHHVCTSSIRLQHTSSKTNYADIFTKSIAPSYFKAAAAAIVFTPNRPSSRMPRASQIMAASQGV